MQDLFYQIALSKIPNVGNQMAKQLVAWCGGVKEVFEASSKDLLKINGIGKKTVKNILEKKYFKDVEKEIRHIKNNNIKTFFYLDKNYPKRLMHYQDAPILLYFKGEADLNYPRTVGIIGTRKPSEWGRFVCEELIEGLKEYEVMVISGLAYGIDITAHKKCLELSIPTIGCLGHGLSMIYPAFHQQTALGMLDMGGLLSEFAYDEIPDGRHFPMRNRVIAGLSDALIVVETPHSGGSMITAEIAHSYNKDIFAVPGRWKDKNSKGCNFLIKTHKANLIQSAEDIAYIMHWDKEKKHSGKQRKLFLNLSDDEQNIVNYLSNKESEDIDTLVHLSQLSQSRIATILLELEFNGVIKSLPGKRYCLI